VSTNTPPPVGAPGLGSAVGSRPRVPSVNLLPPYVAKRQAGRATQIKAFVALALVIVVLGGIYVGLSMWKGGAEDRLADAKAEATRLAAAREQYAEVIAVNEELKMTENALAVAVSYEIRWPELIDAIFRDRPADAVVSTINFQGMSASEAPTAVDNVLAPARIGAVQLVIDVPELKGVAEWVNSFNAIPGLEYGGWTSVNAKGSDSGSAFTVTCSAQVNLVGLVGNVDVFPKDFQEWLALAQVGGEAPPAAEEGGNE
jgi:hypothetical protein